ATGADHRRDQRGRPWRPPLHGAGPGVPRPPGDAQRPLGRARRPRAFRPGGAGPGVRGGDTVTAELRGALAAVCFLTRLPLGRWVTLDASDVARAGIAFPVIGAGMGASVGALAAALAGGLSALLAVAIALTVGTVLTGAL